MLRITAATGNARKKIRSMMQQFRPSRKRRLMRVIGRKLRDEVRNRFTTQGNGTWRPLSAWTQATTGRKKALITLRDRIQMRLISEDEVQVIFDAPTDEWSIDMHHRGFTSPKVDGKRMAFQLARPSAVGRKSNMMVLNRRRASVIPARRVWLTPTETRAVVNREIELFAAQVEAADA